MAPRPKVPFWLHPAAKLRANIEIAQGTDLALSPDGAVAAVIRGPWGQRRLELHTLATGAVEDALPNVGNLNIELPAWSRDGRRWAVAEMRFEGEARRGIIHVGERGRAEPLCTAQVSHYCLIMRNSLARPSTPLAFSPEGDRLALRVSGADDRSALMHISIPDGAVREQWLHEDESDLYANAFSDDGTLYTASADPGDSAGLAWYPPGAGEPAGRLRWVFGFTVIPARRGLWVLGSPRYAFRVAPGPETPFVPAVAPAMERAVALRARASAQWDQRYLDSVLERIATNQTTYNYRVGRSGWGAGTVPPTPAEGARGFEHELQWETSFAARLGDDDVAVSDGVGVWRWRDDGASVTRDLLVDDTQRCTHRGARIIGLSAAGDLLALLWKKDAGGSRTVLSLFDIDRAALGG